jgi:hypothetical protein
VSLGIMVPMNFKIFVSILITAVIVTVVPGHSENSQLDFKPPDINKGFQIRDTGLIVWTDFKGHFAIYRPDTLEFIIFNLDLLNKVADYRKMQIIEAQRNVEDYFINTVFAVVGGVLVLGQDAAENLALPKVILINGFERDDTLGGLIFQYYARQIQEVQDREFAFQNRPLPKELASLSKDFREALLDLADSAYVYNIAIKASKQKPVNAR